ncbi:SHOCT domain-containing protein [Bradyrhizobium sediminis]|uniref:SHOCT domain-containing protein n=1 Tax=Bradyrhizobium sediminis TaxID=2840469 RepID=A0A975RSS4_9BRAD|nr:SHOCT domain-containing protein [Bradyrhizobium sediminis]QWG19272.1 SHOCT domain-containing protein [Bradyrhizobium sediminis]
MPKALTKIVASAGAALALLSSAAWAQTSSDADRYAYGPHMMWWGGGGYAMILGPLFMILVLTALIAAVVLLARWAGGPWQGTIPPHYMPPGRSALDILKERFARGEIDKEEFEQRRRVLGD